MTTRFAQLLLLLAASLALGLLVGGVAAWVPLVLIVLARVVWTAGDRQIRDIVSEPYDAELRAREYR